MRICIFGAGAIGAYLGAGLANAGEDVTLIARGPHLAAMQQNGITVLSESGTLHARPNCTDDTTGLGPQDCVIVTLKAHALTGVVPVLQPLLGPDTTIVTAVNGIPWWYFHGVGGELEGHRLESVDPGGAIWNGIGPERALGCVVYPAAEVEKPGVIRHLEGDRFTLGEPDGTKSPRAEALSAALRNGGFKAPVRKTIRNDIWIKLWGNLCFNPISALTHATLDVIATDPGTRTVARAMMLEAQAIGETLGVRFGVDVDKRIDGAAAVGAHKTSMLQDLERGRPMEVDALLTVVQELGTLTGVATPSIDTVLPLIRQRADVAASGQ